MVSSFWPLSQGMIRAVNSADHGTGFRMTVSYKMLYGRALAAPLRAPLAAAGMATIMEAAANIAMNAALRIGLSPRTHVRT